VVPPGSTPGTPTPSVVPQLQTADPVITKRVNINQAQVGDEAIFSLIVTNNGAIPATDVVVTDPLPAFVAVLDVSATRGDVTIAGNTITVVLGSVGPGEIVTITIRTRIVAVVAAPDNRNIAGLTTTSNGDIISNNQDSVPVNIISSGAGSPSATPLPGGAATPTPGPAGGPGSPPASSIGAPPPSMPSTGSADIGGLRSLIVVLALGLLALGGLLQRQRRAA
jgi:uncharacterized repeat protein (TIGR01451 family)